MSPKWMDVLVRTRQARQDAAQAELGTARRHAEDTRRAAHTADRQVDRLSDRADGTDELSALSFVAASAALQAAAATRSLALFTAAQADLAVDQRRSALAGAAAETGAAENLLERSIGAERAHAEWLAQRDLDELASSMHRRRAAGQS